ncbi:aquaporin-8a.1 [Electrophorus electricus]|uniref:aquaporin-8a.1 n=1 Tax=Electrophorus electricus TaxID=8005 RepID=UPI0015D034A0|nr:aquaporin-8a.1 [Electrophorus electricus]
MDDKETKPELFSVSCAEREQEKQQQKTRAGRVFERYVQPCLAELLGSTLFIFAGCVSVVSNAGVPGTMQPALAHGLALAIVIAVFGEISGGHFNPAVSVCVYLTGGMELILLLPYVLAQMFGGMIGAGLVKVISPSIEYNNVSGAAFSAVKSTEDIGAVTVSEVVMTLFLTMVVSMAAVNGKTRSQFAPFCIGLTVTANILAGGMISGACMNPARAFGPAVVASYWDYHWVYWVGPLAGAMLTVSIVRFLLGDEKTRIIMK